MSIFANADCVEGMKDFPDKYFELAIVDPPYGAISKNVNALMQNGNAYKRNYKMFANERPSKEYFDELFRVSKNQIIWGGNYFAHSLPETNSLIVWDKNNGESKCSDGEIAWTSFDFLLKIWKIHWTGSASLWEDTNGKIHPTQKPTKLYRRCLTEFAQSGDKILDTHAGSASLLIACEQLDFHYVAFEIDSEIYESAKRRLKQFKSQLKLEF